jgi:hypothetical protein
MDRNRLFLYHERTEVNHSDSDIAFFLSWEIGTPPPVTVALGFSVVLEDLSLTASYYLFFPKVVLC